jgi:RNA polymerase sigma-70 factor (ECF subfamily)
VPREETDERLMRRFQAGDAGAFEALVRRHRTVLWNFLLRQVGERARAEELLQETFLRAVKVSAEWQERAKVTTWLFTIARNLALDEARRAVHRRTEPLEGRDDAPGPIDRAAADDPPPDAAAEGALLRPRLEAALAALPPEQREVFLLREQGGLSFPEIAEATGVPENTVKSRMRYALEGLRRTLATLGLTPEALGGSR